MNILLLSIGTRNKVAQYFKRGMAGIGRVITTDMSPYAPALYEGDAHYIVPRITDPSYIDIILDICKKEQITGVMSFIDPELNLLAAHAEDFKAVGTTVIGSSLALCDRALDKMLMYDWLTAHGYRCARSWTEDTMQDFYRELDAGSVTFPVFVKPVCGSASISISRADDRETMEFLLRHGKNMMVQEFMKGQEIGADVYIDMLTGEVVSIFTKKKLVMRAGETDKAISFKDEKLFDLITRFVNESGWRGQIDMDIFEINGEYYISEVNPRFGGGYPHAYESGVDHIALIINNLSGKANTPRIGAYEEGIVMMKYNEIGITRAVKA